MRTVQMTLDEDLVSAVDKAARQLGTTRSAFAREDLRDALRRVRVAELEKWHRDGYTRRPIQRGELSVWEHEQVWPE